MLLCVCSHWNNQGTIRNHYMAISIITPPQRYRKVLAGQFDDVSGTFLNRCPCQSMRVGMMGNDGECPMHNQRHCLRFTPLSAPQNLGALRPTYGISMHFLYVLSHCKKKAQHAVAKKLPTKMWCATTVSAMGQSTTNITIGLGTPQCRYIP